ncbi:transcriptional regulator, Crp/Fnr family [Caenispirillum salinarum AK4]|uniref:Transcriptional regulator, Crp/Fnr family n=1 Tax=Caenispirillum salinarum AK4 TaxID=1238182 RepID=K9HEM4_9PROT|nr:Crp/Fnr family transcriptional regulator [Caenispirillum salinarum]EKV28958.1 transcriptional regulator, Crp/Fnr family [Caenispirillum salinarum AK4]
MSGRCGPARTPRAAASLEAADRRTIRRASIFGALDDATFDLLVEPVRVETVAEGGTLFLQGDPAEAFYVAVDGWLQMVRDTSDGARTVIKLIGPGESFAEALIMPGARYPVAAEAATPVRAARFEAARFRALVEQTPGLGLSIVAATFRQMQRLVDQIEHLKSWSVDRRVADMLLQMHAGAGHPATAFPLPVEQSVIAARLAVTPSTLSRSLRKLSALGVDARRGRITLHDPDRLRAYVAEAAD